MVELPLRLGPVDETFWEQVYVHSFLALRKTVPIIVLFFTAYAYWVRLRNPGGESEIIRDGIACLVCFSAFQISQAYGRIKRYYGANRERLLAQSWTISQEGLQVKSQLAPWKLFKSVALVPGHLVLIDVNGAPLSLVNRAIPAGVRSSDVQATVRELIRSAR